MGTSTDETTDETTTDGPGTGTGAPARASADPIAAMRSDAVEPARADRDVPTLGAALLTWSRLGAATVMLNLILLAVAGGLGATMVVDIGASTQSIGALPVVAATAGALLTSTLAWAFVAYRVPAFAHLWVPLGWGVGLVSLGGIIGASDVSTAVALGAMHVVTTAVATLWLPRRLPR